MTLPLHTILVRHGESEGNVANARSSHGDHSAFDDIFRQRHSAWWRLTDEGQAQAVAAGEWIRENFGTIEFDKYFVSSFARAMETAALLDLPNAEWCINTDIRERNWGDYDVLPKSERAPLQSVAMMTKPTAPFYWKPPNGESLADVGVRLKTVLDTLHRESNTAAMMVCHGEVMSTFHRLLTRATDEEFARRTMSHDPIDQIHNCTVHWYTRVDPYTGIVSPAVSYWRSVCAPDPSVADTGWVPITRTRYSNEDLLAMVNKHERLLMQ